MQHRELGASGVSVPPIVFGVSSLGNLFHAPSDETKLAISKAWFDEVEAPVAIDAAGKYGAGLALEVLGRNLRALDVDPADVLLSNKLGWKRAPLTSPEPTFEPGAWVGLEHDAERRISHQGALDCWEEGNRLLGDPYRAELLSIHDPDEYLAEAPDEEDRLRRLDDIRGAYRALHELKQAGEAKAIGVGSKDWRVIQELDQMVELDWVMFANSLTVYRHPAEVVEFIDDLAARGIGVINSAVFNAGFLVGGAYFDYRLVEREEEPDLFVWREKFMSHCQTHSVSPAVACVQFGASPPGVQAIAMNTGKPERIAEDVSAVMAEVPADFWADMKKSGLIVPSYPHLGG